jgi:hypothetical protein
MARWFIGTLLCAWVKNEVLKKSERSGAGECYGGIDGQETRIHHLRDEETRKTEQEKVKNALRA